MTLEQDLRSQIARAYGQKRWEENPLVTIGLSHAILSLKVTDAQLFKIVRGYLRQLAAAVHPDTVAGDVPEIVEERLKIMNAFELLDDEKIFLNALEEFRALKSDERREIRTLRESLRNAQKQLQEANEAVRQIGEERRALERARGAFERIKCDERPLLPSLEHERRMADAARQRWLSLLKEKSNLNRGLVRIIRWYQAYLLIQSIRFVGGRDRIPLLPSDANQISVLRFDIRPPDSPRSLIPTAIPEALRGRYADCERRLGEVVAQKFHGRRIVDCSFQTLAIKGGCIGQTQKVRQRKINVQERVVGSLRLEEAAVSSYKRLERLPNPLVLRHLVPFLIPGSFLVSLSYRKRTTLFTDYDAVYDLMASEAKKHRGETPFRSDTIILDVQ